MRKKAEGKSERLCVCVGVLNFHATQQRRKSQSYPDLSHWVTQLLGGQDKSAEDQGNLLTWQIINTLKPTTKAEMEAVIIQMLSKSGSWRRGREGQFLLVQGLGKDWPFGRPRFRGAH